MDLRVMPIQATLSFLTRAVSHQRDRMKNRSSPHHHHQDHLHQAVGVHLVRVDSMLQVTTPRIAVQTQRSSALVSVVNAVCFMQCSAFVFLIGRSKLSPG